MPELPEVERARRELESVAKGPTGGHRISSVVGMEDNIVYNGCTSAQFTEAITGKDVLDVRRIGKNFYLILSSPPHPVFHLGMAGSTQIRGLAATTYRLPRSRNDPSVWPPKYCKLVLTFSTLDGSPMAEWAFCDSRRLARIKLVDQEVPEEHPPLSLLGRDPFLDMPPLEVLSPALLKRNSPIKAVLLNQNGPLSGIGNWIVDEVLFQARLHPTHPAYLLSAPDLSILHEKIKYIIDFAVEVNADHRQFPPDWLFMKRWGKGKKKVPQYEMNGTSHPITFHTVGGRTSAVVEALQVLPDAVREVVEGKLRVALEKKAAKVAANGAIARQGKRLYSSDEEDPSAAAEKEEVDAEVATAAQQGWLDHEGLAGTTSPYFSQVTASTSASATFKLPESLVSPTKSNRSSIMPSPDKRRPVVKRVRKVTVKPEGAEGETTVKAKKSRAKKAVVKGEKGVAGPSRPRASKRLSGGIAEIEQEG